jgi:hypothetical protein
VLSSFNVWFRGTRRGFESPPLHIHRPLVAMPRFKMINMLHCLKKFLFCFSIIAISTTSCYEKVDEYLNDFEFISNDKDLNEIKFYITIKYKINKSLELKLKKELGDKFRNKFFLPIIKSVSKSVFSEYSAADIYSYERSNIESSIEERLKLEFKKNRIEITDFLIRSVVLSEELSEKLEKEHVERFLNALNKCSKETKVVITKIRDSIGFYQFSVDEKIFNGLLMPNDLKSGLKAGDSILIEYACEKPIFHRLKKNRN